MDIPYVAQAMIWPAIEKNQGFFGFVVSIASVLVTIVIGIWVVRTVSQIVNEHRVSARFGFYINLSGYLVLLGKEMKKGDRLLAHFFTNQTIREDVCGKNITMASEEERKCFANICKIFSNFLLSSESNVPPQRAYKVWKVSKKNARKQWAEHQLVLVKFLHKGIAISTIPYYNEGVENNVKVVFHNEIATVNTAISKLSEVIKPEIGLEFNTSEDKHRAYLHSFHSICYKN